MICRWIIIASLMLIAAIPSLAQNRLIAYVQDGEVFLLGPNGSVQVTRTEQEYKYIADMRWSPDGSRLAFTQYIEEIGSDGYPFYRTDLFVIDPSNLTPGSLTAVGEDISAGFPPAWAEDGTLYFVRDNPNNMSAMSPEDFMMDIFRVTNNGVRAVASVPFGAGCGGGTSEPHYMLYNTEAGFGGNAITFLATRYGLLMSLNCGGGGLQLVGFDGTITRLDDVLARVALAADGRTLAALALDYSSFPPLTTLYLYDLETRTLRQTSTSKLVDQVGWGGDGALYYSSSVPSGELFTAEEATLIGEAQGYDTSFMIPAPIPYYRVTVNRIDLVSGSEMEVAAHDASFVGRLRPVAGGVAYSVIGSLEAWGRGLIDGSIDPMSEAYYNNLTNYVSLESFIFQSANDRSVSLGRLAQMEIAP
ncbi:MAG: hypothetical protein NZ750_08335 [Anaerolineae bacterium]|nr:hypothetical protein [Anaerolineae bacterium]MDW8172355.1 hypothetical protein [Anaerolineae bacterium]